MNENKKHLTPNQVRYFVAVVVLVNIILTLVTLGIIMQRSQTTSEPVDGKARFVISSWSYPDEYSQGIQRIDVWKSGVWYGDIFPSETVGINIETNDSFYMEFPVWINGTLIGTTDLDDAKDYFRFNVSIVDISAGTLLFTDDNLTYDDSTDLMSPMLLYTYKTTLAPAWVGLASYQLRVTLDIYYSGLDPTNETLLLASAGSAYGPSGTYEDTHALDASYYQSYDGSGPYVAYMYLNFSLGEIPPAAIKSVDVAFYGRGLGGSVSSNIFGVYDAGNEPYEDLGDLYIHSTVNDWVNLTLTDPKYFLDPIQFYFEIISTSLPYAYIYADYMECVVSFTPFGWHETSIAECTFLVGMSSETQWAYNGLLFLFGCVLVIFSTTYLALKFKSHDMNADVAFYAVTGFVFGWCLIIAVLSG